MLIGASVQEAAWLRTVVRQVSVSLALPMFVGCCDAFWFVLCHRFFLLSTSLHAFVVERFCTSRRWRCCSRCWSWAPLLLVGLLFFLERSGVEMSRNAEFEASLSLSSCCYSHPSCFYSQSSSPCAFTLQLLGIRRRGLSCSTVYSYSAVLSTFSFLLVTTHRLLMISVEVDCSSVVPGSRHTAAGRYYRGAVDRNYRAATLIRRLCGVLFGSVLSVGGPRQLCIARSKWFFCLKPVFVLPFASSLDCSFHV